MFLYFLGLLELLLLLLLVHEYSCELGETSAADTEVYGRERVVDRSDNERVPNPDETSCSEC